MLDFSILFISFDFLAIKSARSSSSNNLKSYSVRKSSMTQQRPTGQCEEALWKDGGVVVKEVSFSIVITVEILWTFKLGFEGSPFTLGTNIFWSKDKTEFVEDFLLNLFQNSPVLSCDDILDVDDETDLIEAYVSEDDLEGFEERVSEE